jgi:N-acetylneuraminate lyase
MEVFSGIWPALMTPSAADNSVNLAATGVLIDHLIDKGVNGFYLGGTTGEGIYMPTSERIRLIEFALKRIDGRVPSIVHVGAVAVDDAVAMARHARDHGAVGISSVLPPLYETMDSLHRYYAAVAASVPEIQLTAYLLNPRIDSVAFVRTLTDIPNLGGAKYTGPNMYELRQIIDMGAGKWTVFSGMDEQAVYGLMMGASGLVGSTLNFMPGVYLTMNKLVREGRLQEAQDLQVRANAVITAMISVGFGGALKAVISDLLGVDMGAARLPHPPLTPQNAAALREKLAQTDFAALVAL